jgi:uncharacterized protein YcsI (UPF0317 family)
MARRIMVSHQPFIALACMDITAKAAGMVESTIRQATGAGTRAAESTARHIMVVRQKFSTSACMSIIGQAGGTMAVTMRQVAAVARARKAIRITAGVNTTHGATSEALGTEDTSIAAPGQIVIPDFAITTSRQSVV